MEAPKNKQNEPPTVPLQHYFRLKSMLPFSFPVVESHLPNQDREIWVDRTFHETRKKSEYPSFLNERKNDPLQK